MPRTYIYADEAGDLTFKNVKGASRYFILCTVTLDPSAIGPDLLKLRRKMAWAGLPLQDYFHCTTDKQDVRDLVFHTICKHDFGVQATVMEKCKAQPQMRRSRPRFYQYGWLYHFKYGMESHIRSNSGSHPKVLITAASLGEKRERMAFLNAIRDVMGQTVPGTWATQFCAAAADPCLQVADYCAWAIQKKWERNDRRSYDLIKDRIEYEYNLWKHGNIGYY